MIPAIGTSVPLASFASVVTSDAIGVTAWASAEPLRCPSPAHDAYRPVGDDGQRDGHD